MNSTPASAGSALTDPHIALAALLNRLAPVRTERVALAEATGRVLAERICADRPSPACDVSAMDGYAVRLADLAQEALSVVGEVAIGQPPPPLPPGRAVRIFTGGAVPTEAEVVVRREDVSETPHAITPAEDLASRIKSGANIRRQGENIPAGECVLSAGAPITSATVAALANFGVSEPLVYRRVRLSLLVTGNEVLEVGSKPTPWQLRDSNGPTLHALLAGLPWIEEVNLSHIEDEPGTVRAALEHALTTSDGVLLTGGVSMGDHDYVPEQVRSIGSETLFHKLALRPGKPMLGAVTASGQAILGLPGNPVSVMTTARRLALPALRRLGGWAVPDAPVPVVKLTNADDKELGLWWYRPVRLGGAGEAALVPTMGSGDLVSAARSDGFIELPPHAAGSGPWPFYSWSMLP